MRHFFIVLVVLATLATAGCVSVSVFGVVGDESELYIGTATGYANKTGTIELKNDKGNRCTGDFVYTSHLRGHGLLACDDGQRAMIDFRGLTSLSGYGVGTSDTGQKIVFTYGLSRAESARYLGFSVAGAAVPGATVPGATVPGAPGTTRTLRKIGSGTGLFVSRAGHVLTNEHVIRACTHVRVHTGGATVAASIAVSDKTNDLALLKAGIAPSAVATLRGRPARQGEAVVAFGFPLSESLASGGILTTGSVSAVSGLRDDSRFIQISAPIQPGSSGGPILDASGAAIGIATSTYIGQRENNVPQNVNFALKADIARTFLNAAGVTPETTPAGVRDLGVPELGERARGFTVRVECYR